MLHCLGIGWATCKRLSTLGIETIDAVQACDQSLLIQEFGTAQAQLMIQLCQGIDPSPVVSKGLPQVCMQCLGFLKIKSYHGVNLACKHQVYEL